MVNTHVSASDLSSLNDIIHLKFGVEAVSIVGKELEIIQKQQEFAKDGAIRLLNGYNVLPYNYSKLEDKLFDYEYRETDVFVVGYPKTGTTWVQEIVWTILHNSDNNNPKQDKYMPFERAPFFDDTFKSFLKFTRSSAMEKFKSPWSDALCKNSYVYLQCDPELELQEMWKKYPNPRIYKSHLTANLVNPKMLEKSKIIYTVRNPFDSFLSYYYYSKTYFSNYFHGDLNDFFYTYINELVMHGTAPHHVKGWWPYKNHKNVYFLFYEDLLKSPASEIQRLASFLGKDLNDKQLCHVIEKTTFENMKNAMSPHELSGTQQFCKREQLSKTGGFFRSGKSGMSKKTLSKEMYDKLADYFKKHFQDIPVPYIF